MNPVNTAMTTSNNNDSNMMSNNVENPGTSEPTLATQVSSDLSQGGGKKHIATNESLGTSNQDNGQESCTDNGTSSNRELSGGKENAESKKEEEEQGGKNDSSTISTAFTISFEDEPTSNSRKLFGIRDSIRKFAPPKPNTIEKPRPSRADGQDASYASIESAPGGYQHKQQFSRGAVNASCRSSGRKSDSSRHSNISESAAFLIDRMFNCEQGESLSSICLNDKSKSSSQIGRSASESAKKKLATRSNDDILDDEIDYCDEKSDNGTYIVGADPESEAARKKIDELFGVVKAAEASIILASSTKRASRPLATVSRQNRRAECKPTYQEHQEHMSRPANVRNSSRSSSSSRQDVGSSTGQRPRSTTRNSRNSSCDRAVSKLPSGRPRRATSQSSRQSSNKELSDGDTQSSRSSLHTNMIEAHNSDAQPANHPNMKFNRAFALRRARLGLGEPAGRMTSTPTSSCLSQEPDSLTMSPRRSGASNRCALNRAAGQQSLSRTDGGRFSLRMKNAPMPNRLNSGHTSGRTLGQQGALIDGYMSKVASCKVPLPTTSYVSPHISPMHSVSVNHPSKVLPYQSSDELELSSISRYKCLGSSSAHHRSARNELHHSELEGDADYYSRFNYSLNLETENYNTSESNMRACSSASRRPSNPGRLGALDCLVISAISSLAVKIRASVCDLMVEHAKRLPSGNETRTVVEEILPQLAANSTRPKSPTSIEEIDQSLYFDLAQTLKNLKKVEQIVDVMKLISNQTQPNSCALKTGGSSNTHTSHSRSSGGQHRAMQTSSAEQAADGGVDSNTNSEGNSLSPV